MNDKPNDGDGFERFQMDPFKEIALMDSNEQRAAEETDRVCQSDDAVHNVGCLCEPQDVHEDDYPDFEAPDFEPMSEDEREADILGTLEELVRDD